MRSVLPGTGSKMTRAPASRSFHSTERDQNQGVNKCLILSAAKENYHTEGEVVKKGLSVEVTLECGIVQPISLRSNGCYGKYAGWGRGGRASGRKQL